MRTETVFCHSPGENWLKLGLCFSGLFPFPMSWENGEKGSCCLGSRYENLMVKRTKPSILVHLHTNVRRQTSILLKSEYLRVFQLHPFHSGHNRGWGGWMASPTLWTWVWVNWGSWWWTGRPGALQSTGSQSIGHGWATELTVAATPGIYLTQCAPSACTLAAGIRAYHRLLLISGPKL